MNAGPTFFDDTINQAILLYPLGPNERMDCQNRKKKKKSHQKEIEILQHLLNVWEIQNMKSVLKRETL